jgi:hypothetical protein
LPQGKRGDILVDWSVAGRKSGTPVIWSAAEFDSWFNTVSDPVRQQRALDDLTASQRKLRRERRTFIQFASAAKLDVDPRTIQNRDVPEPDIYCEVSGSSRYFELGELTDERIPQNEARARRAGRDIHGGYISQSGALEKMIFAKCAKTYHSRDVTVGLLLHFSVGHQVPCSQFLAAWLSESGANVMAALHSSPFDTIWIFDCWTDRILRVIRR